MCIRDSEWSAVLLMGGMQPLGLAMQKTGAADLLANALTRFITRPTPFVLTATVILVAGMLAQFMSHTAATSILAPVCVALSRRLGVNPAPLLMALCQATSIAVATPIGTPPNVIVYQPVSYTHLDVYKRQPSVPGCKKKTMPGSPKKAKENGAGKKFPTGCEGMPISAISSRTRP